MKYCAVWLRAVWSGVIQYIMCSYEEYCSGELFGLVDYNVVWCSKDWSRIIKYGPVECSLVQWSTVLSSEFKCGPFGFSVVWCISVLSGKLLPDPDDLICFSGVQFDPLK